MGSLWRAKKEAFMEVHMQGINQVTEECCEQ